MLEWNGERVVPEKMMGEDPTLLEHLVRYRFACEYCKGMRVLDASCGSGYGSKMIQTVAKEVIGIDIDEQTIIYAREKYPNIHFEICDLEFNFPKVDCDIIISFETIEHLENPNYFLENTAKACEKFIFSIPLNNPSQFHKQVYSLDGAQDLIYQYFNDVVWFEQTRVKISPLSKESVFLLGIAE